MYKFYYSGSGGEGKTHYRKTPEDWIDCNKWITRF